MSDPDLRECGTCHVERPLKLFFRKHPDKCRICIMNEARLNRPPEERKAKLTLEQQVEAHRQEKIVKKLMREELKKIARDRLQKRKKARKLAAQKKLAPDVDTSVVVDPVAKEMAQRTLSRRRLIEFIQEFHPRYMAGWVHHDICRRLEKFSEDVAAGKSPRLMILMPPRHGKSQIASKLYPAWHLGHYNHHEIIACSYNVSLALDFSREVRDVVRSERYGILFPGAKINPEAQSAEAWRLLSPTGVGSGGYVAAGIGGPINGKGAHVLIIDDPIKNAEEADSPELRKKIWDWYGSTAYTRLAPGGGVLVIQTWWHDDDLAGRLQEAMKGGAAEDGHEETSDQFEIVKYPAIAVEDEEYRMKGDALHPERYDVRALMKIKNAVGPRFWAALYQQDPVPDDGAYFTKDMLVKRMEGVDWRRMHVYQAWDFAIGDKKTNDWNVGVTIGLDYDDVVHVLEVRRFKTSDAGRLVDEVLDMYERYGSSQFVQCVGAEDGPIWRTMDVMLKKRMTERSLYPTFEVLRPLNDKMARARPLQGRMYNKKVTFPAIAPWWEVVEKELLRFPAGKNDDIVDALAWVVTMVIGKAPPKRPASALGYGRREKTVAEKIRALARTGEAGPMSA